MRRLEIEFTTENIFISNSIFFLFSLPIRHFDVVVFYDFSKKKLVNVLLQSVILKKLLASKKKKTIITMRKTAV